ncbi:MAG: Sir2 family NAD-dependent protein deacetylase [Bacteroidota bacterium]
MPSISKVFPFSLRSKPKKHIVILTGAGISAESGLPTFRGLDGLWNGYKISEVASPEAFSKNPQLVLDFYNQRRAQCKTALPNPAHYALATLEERYEVSLFTQNIDPLHEKAGSQSVTHLHGRIDFARSVENLEEIVPIEGDIHLGDTGLDGAQLRPYVVWFGEEIHALSYAERCFSTADIVIVIGTSLSVFPANTLIENTSLESPLYIIDPNPGEYFPERAIHIREKASEGVPKLVEELMRIK